MRLWLPIACSVACAVMGAATAQAHEPPKGLQLLWPDERGGLPIVVTNRGLIFPTDEENSRFALRCNEAYGAPTTYVPFVSHGPSSDSLLMGAPDMVAVASARACEFDVRLDLRASDSVLGAIAQWPQEPTRLLLSTVPTESPSALWRSDDRGVSWTLQQALPEKVFYTRFVVAPGDATRVYASVAKLDAETAKVVQLWSRSEDGGLTWVESVQSAERTPFAVHPLNADVVFALEAADPTGSVLRVLRSEDAGENFESVLELPEIGSFAAKPDGSSIWIGSGREGGLHLSTDGGKTFARVLEELQDIDCLVYREDTLWLCANRLPNLDGIWKLADGATEFEQVLTFDQVTEPVFCEGEAADVCRVPWSDWQREVFPQESPDAGVLDAGVDGGAQEPPQDAGADAPAKPDATCSLRSSAAPARGLELMGLMLAVYLSRRLRRRATGSPPA